MTQRLVFSLTLAVSLAFTLPLAGRIHAQTAAPTPTTKIHVGILREDGVLIPFARFNGSRWSVSWGPGSNDVTSRTAQGTPAQIPPIWWGGSPAQNDWRLIVDGGQPATVRALGAIRYENHCTGGIGLKTDYISHVTIEPNSYPLPYAGIVVSTDGLAAPGVIASAVLDLHPGAPDYDFVVRQLPSLLARREPRLWADYDTRYRPDLSGPLPPPEYVTVLAGTLADGRRLIHFSAIRYLLKGLDGKAIEAATKINGWFVRATDATEPALLDARVSISDVDGKGGDGELLPAFASVSVGRRHFWIGTVGGYESESYVVIEVTSGKPAIVTAFEAGGC